MYLGHTDVLHGRRRLDRTHPLQAQPGPTLQVLSLEMQESPQALPVVQTRQHASEGLPSEQAGVNVVMGRIRSSSRILRMRSSGRNVVIKTRARPQCDLLAPTQSYGDVTSPLSASIAHPKLLSLLALHNPCDPFSRRAERLTTRVCSRSAASHSVRL